MKRDEVDVVQFALPVAGDNDIQIINNLRDQVQSPQRDVDRPNTSRYPNGAR